MTRIVSIREALIDEITRLNSEPVEVVGGSTLRRSRSDPAGSESSGDLVRVRGETPNRRVTLTPALTGRILP